MRVKNLYIRGDFPKPSAQNPASISMKILRLNDAKISRPKEFFEFLANFCPNLEVLELSFIKPRYGHVYVYDENEKKIEDEAALEVIRQHVGLLPNLRSHKIEISTGPPLAFAGRHHEAVLRFIEDEKREEESESDSW